MKQNVPGTVVKRLMFGFFSRLPRLVMVLDILPFPSTAFAGSTN